MKVIRTIPKPGLLLMASLLFYQNGCGTRVGDPDDEADTANSSVLPTVVFDIPETISGLALAPGQDSLIYMWANRTERIIQDINGNLERLNSDTVPTTGEFSGKGPEGGMRGMIEDISDAPYTKKATICTKAGPMLVLKWDAEGNNIYFIRDFSISTVRTENRNTTVSEAYYTRTDTQTTVQLYVDGKPWRTPPGQTATNLVESIYAVKDSSENMTLRGTNSWFNAEPTAANGYLVGSFDQNGAGEFLGYQDLDPNCSSFDETNTAAPGWCLGGDLSSGSTYTAEQRDSTWTQLGSVGIEPFSNIKRVSMGADVTCPSPP